MFRYEYICMVHNLILLYINMQSSSSNHICQVDHLLLCRSGGFTICYCAGLVGLPSVNVQVWWVDHLLLCRTGLVGWPSVTVQVWWFYHLLMCRSGGFTICYCAGLVGSLAGGLLGPKGAMAASALGKINRLCHAPWHSLVMCWYSLCHALTQSLSCTGTVFVMHWHSLCHALAQSLSCTDKVVVMHWHSRCHALTQSLSCTGTAFVMHWHILCHALTHWLNIFLENTLHPYLPFCHYCTFM